MALTIEQKPPTVARSEDYLFYRVSSTNSNQTGFK